MFPEIRLRRLRLDQNIRDVLSEFSIRTEKLIMPVFLDETHKGKNQIPGMPDIFRHDFDSAKEYLQRLSDIGVKGVLLFGIPKVKDRTGSSSYSNDGIVQKTISYIRDNLDMITYADLCLCEYTDNGQCGLVVDGYVDNDSTLEIYQKIAVSYADAGVDVVAPSGMMDGQVSAIRKALDASNHKNTLIMAYSAKYASSLYGPFRNAVDSAPKFGDRRSYQMPVSNSREAMREIDLDVKEGADIVMVKPATFYLDIISKARSSFNLPIAAYSVSGEYSMIRSAIEQKLVSGDFIGESLVSIFRAGADLVISYFTESILSG
ncbi:MAG: porphobilinogen synthase [Thermoplasmata archaeon]